MKWPGGNPPCSDATSMMLSSRNENSMGETDCNANGSLAYSTNLSSQQIGPTKKLWGVGEEPKDESNKGIFNLSEQPWRDTAWSTGPAADHAVSQPISLVPRRSGNFTGGVIPPDVNSVLSPRSETGGLGVKMVEYVLATSPTSKDIETRMRILDLNSTDNDKDKADKNQTNFENKDVESGSNQQANGIVQNGLQEDDKSFNRTPGSRQPSPAEEDISLKNGHVMNSQKTDDLVTSGALGQPTLGLEGSTGMSDPVIMDPNLPFDSNYGLMPTMDSPGNLLAANLDSQQQQQQLYRNNQQQQPPIHLVAQQQQYLQSQQLGIPPGAFPSGPYVINPQEPYLGTLIAGPAVVPQYYGLPWGVYSANLIQQGAPAPQQRRPLTPSQQNDPAGQSNLPQVQGGQYQVIPAYYDQNGSLVMGNPRGPSGAPVRLISPAPVLINAGALSGGQQLGTPPASLYNNSGPTSLYNPPSSSAGGIGGLPSSNTPLAGGFNSLGLQQSSALGYGSSALGLGTGTNARRDSFDRSSSAFSPSLDYRNGKWPQNYGALGPLGLSGSLTPPPPSLSGSSSSLPLGGLMAGGGSRVISAAPGAETRLRNGGLTNGMINSCTLFPNLKRSTGLEKQTGRSRLLEEFRAYMLAEKTKGVFPGEDSGLGSPQWGLDGTQPDLFGDSNRNNRYPSLQLRDISNHVVEFSQDQHGSRFIQQKLERASPADKQLVFNEILVAAYTLMMDVFGNYVIQKFFEFGTGEQKTALAQKIKGHVLPLAVQMYGCRVIQKALECITPELQKDLVRELDGHVLKCVKDQNGNHVVQKCIESVEPMALQFIVDAFRGQVYSLSTHPYGCRVIQRILEHCTMEQTAPILEELHQNTEQLIQDQYGNYVVQHVLEHGKPEDKAKIVAVVRGKVLQLSQHKFASNVVEKCTAHATRAERAVLIDEVCGYSDGPQSALHIMMKDQFANYVVQKMIDVAEPAQRKIIMHKIRPHISALRKFTYGKHIIAKLEKYFMKNSSDLGSIGLPGSSAAL